MAGEWKPLSLRGKGVLGAFGKRRSVKFVVQIKFRADDEKSEQGSNQDKGSAQPLASGQRFLAPPRGRGFAQTPAVPKQPQIQERHSRRNCQQRQPNRRRMRQQASYDEQRAAAQESAGPAGAHKKDARRFH